MEFIHHPGDSHRLGDWLKNNLEKDWTHFRAAIAFVKRSGTRHIVEPLTAFAKSRHVEIITGIDHRGTSYEGLLELLHAVSPTGRIIVFHNRLPLTFHAKVYLFKSQTAADLVVGSGNLTEGGLFTNYEASLRLELNLTEPDQVATLQSIEHTLDDWASTARGTSFDLDEKFLNQLKDWDLVAPETGVASHPTMVQPHALATGESAESPFTAVPERRAPRISKSKKNAGTNSGDGNLLVPKLQGGQFLMTLQRTDVGVGQTTAGTSRRSPEIFVPLAARNTNPTFWDWPQQFVQDSTTLGKFDRRGVRMRLDGKTIAVNMMTGGAKHDFRLRNESLRSAGSIGDILKMEKADSAEDFDYYIELIQSRSDEYPSYFLKCNQLVRNSKKRFGYF